MQLSEFSKKNNGRAILFILVIGLSLNIASVNAQQGKYPELRMTRQEILTAKATGPSAPGSSNLSAVEVIVIYGDPSKPGLYTILLKVAPDTKIPAHLHPDERVGTVIAGTWFFGYGDKFDKNKLKELPAGSIYSEVAKQNHFAMTGAEPVIVEITGYGPSGVTYVNTEDDPKNQKH
jgi:hypothetical protein